MMDVARILRTMQELHELSGSDVDLLISTSSFFVNDEPIRLSTRIGSTRVAIQGFDMGETLKRLKKIILEETPRVKQREIDELQAKLAKLETTK